MTHIERADKVLSVAINEAVKGLSAASASYIRQRVETCLSTALAMCKEDAQETHRRIDEARK